MRAGAALKPLRSPCIQNERPRTLPILKSEQFLDESSSSSLHLRRRVQLVISSQQDETQERSGPTRYLAADIASSVAEPAEEGADYGRKYVQSRAIAVLVDDPIDGTLDDDNQGFICFEHLIRILPPCKDVCKSLQVFFELRNPFGVVGLGARRIPVLSLAPRGRQSCAGRGLIPLHGCVGSDLDRLGRVIVSVFSVASGSEVCGNCEVASSQRVSIAIRMRSCSPSSRRCEWSFVDQ